MQCPLCQNTSINTLLELEEKQYGQIRQLEYLSCQNCELVFLHPEQRLDAKSEKQRYATHKNETDSPGYLEFLDRLWQPLKELLLAEAQGLDIGCGPNPVLAKHVASQGFEMNYWDPFFFPKKPFGVYDFLTCTEVLEHMSAPIDDLVRWNHQLKSGGIVGIMTKLFPGKEKFKDWYYRKDPTHICFYNNKSLSYLAEALGWRDGLIGDQVQIFIKS